MSELILDFFGRGMKIKGDEDVLRNLAADFAAFGSVKNAGVFPVEMNLHLGAHAGNEAGPFLFKTRLCRVHGLGRRRYCDYGNGSAVISLNSPSGREFSVYSPDPEVLYEISFMAILSAAGEMLEDEGFRRIHALGLERDGIGIIVPLPRGGGKSAIAMNLDKLEGCRLFSDETPLLKNGVLYPFPLRLALSPDVARALGAKNGRVLRRKLFDSKEVFPFPAEKTAQPAPVRLILAGSVSEAGPEIKQANRAAGLQALFSTMVVGLGVPQMAEHLLRLESFPRLAKAAAGRAREAFIAVQRADVYEFKLSKDAFKNIEVLALFLDSWFRKNAHE